jgi:hypothetical protein
LAQEDAVAIAAGDLVGAFKAVPDQRVPEGPATAVTGDLFDIRVDLNLIQGPGIFSARRRLWLGSGHREAPVLTKYLRFKVYQGIRKSPSRTGGRPDLAQNLPTPHFTDNPVILGRVDHYLTIDIAVEAVLQSWRMSLFSYEWVDKNGKIKSAGDLKPEDQERRKAVEIALTHETPLERPVLGIGLLDNVEIGSGRAIFLTLAALGYGTIPVHIPKTHEKEFAPFRA